MSILRRTFDSLKRLEARADAWAACRLSPEAYAEAVALDVQLKRHFWKWLASFIGLGIAGAAILRLVKPTATWTSALGVSYLLLLGLLILLLSAWFGYPKFVGPKSLRRFVLLVLGMFAGGITGAVVGTLSKGQSLLEVSPDKILSIFVAISIVAVIVVAVISTVAWLRNRHVRQRLSALQAEADRERLARQHTQAELKLLQAQIEPHFLFNTLANLRVLVETDRREALAMLDHLIHYLRTALPEIRAESSTVGREIELARSYLEVLRIRMGGALAIATSTPDELASKPFPPMMLLTLVENAIKHGIAPVGHGSVRVRAEAAGDAVRMVVEDDGRGLGGTLGQGMGLSNVRDRLRALFKDRARLTLAARADGGTVATIEVPQ